MDGGHQRRFEAESLRLKASRYAAHSDLDTAIARLHDVSACGGHDDDDKEKKCDSNQPRNSSRAHCSDSTVQAINRLQSNKQSKLFSKRRIFVTQVSPNRRT